VRWILAIIGEGKRIYLRAPAPPKIWDSGQSIPSDHTVKFLNHTTLAYIQGINASLLTKLQMDQLTDKERVILDEYGRTIHILYIKASIILRRLSSGR